MLPLHECLPAVYNKPNHRLRWHQDNEGRAYHQMAEALAFIFAGEPRRLNFKPVFSMYPRLEMIYSLKCTKNFIVLVTPLANELFLHSKARSNCETPSITLAWRRGIPLAEAKHLYPHLSRFKRLGKWSSKDLDGKMHENFVVRFSWKISHLVGCIHRGFQCYHDAYWEVPIYHWYILRFCVSHLPILKHKISATSRDATITLPLYTSDMPLYLQNSNQISTHPCKFLDPHMLCITNPISTNPTKILVPNLVGSQCKTHTQKSIPIKSILAHRSSTLLRIKGK